MPPLTGTAKTQCVERFFFSFHFLHSLFSLLAAHLCGCFCCCENTARCVHRLQASTLIISHVHYTRTSLSLCHFSTQVETVGDKYMAGKFKSKQAAKIVKLQCVLERNPVVDIDYSGHSLDYIPFFLSLSLSSLLTFILPYSRRCAFALGLLDFHR